jgi:hypothetical protein
MKQNELNFFLRSLVSARKIDAIQKLLDEINKPDSPIDNNILNLSVGDSNSSNLLCWAIRLQNINFAKKVIQVSTKENLSYLDNENNNALLLATNLFQKEVIDLILEKNPELLNVPNKKGITAYGLFLSFPNKYIDYAINPNVVCHINFDKIYLVENSETHSLFDNEKLKNDDKYKQAIDLLINKFNFNHEIIDKKEITFWKFFLSDLDWDYSKECLNKINNTININQMSEKKKSLIHQMSSLQAANYFYRLNKMPEYEDKLKWIISQPNIDVNLEDESKNKPIHLLSANNVDIEIFKSVLEKTKVLNTKNSQGLEAWELALMSNNRPIIEYLESFTEKKIMENTLSESKEIDTPIKKKNRKI